MKKVVLSCSFLLAVLVSFAQNTDRRTERDAKKEARRQKIDNLIRQQEEGALIFNKQSVFGLRLNTDGWGLLYEKGYMKDANTANLFALEFNEKKHPKEKKLNNVLNNNGFLQLGNPYVYGKRNSFYQVKLSYGQQRMLGAKANKNGVAVHAIYGGGFSAGLERPYYVRIQDPGPNGSRDIKYSKADSASFLEPGNIIMGTGLRHGWNELKFVPGVHAKAALRFDYGRFNETVAAIEIGMNLEAYSRKVEIMLLNPAQQVFFNGYIAILFGKRK
ncbi:hypothetical protein IQ13_0266 [Lacibacter cauensis]|uniref:Outer membrane protein with beta-barrel domain n=1 Tax=Lacibacter cauensis TaxID=510947 RepID=A0A562SWI1_9BACT|nr:hypothetical protein [Lacibacter cauensis]TWI85110.1 hypothetical protein IQ13_0266 [Lacibacter cauensis]